MKFRNHNKLLSKYKGTDGIKTGYIRASGFNLVASVKRDNTRLIGVVFGGISGSRRDMHMMYLLNKGFRTVVHLQQRPVDKTETIAYARLMGRNVSEENVVTTAKIQKQEKEQEQEQGSLTPIDKGWGVQLGAYRSIYIAKKVAKSTISLLPNNADVNIEILEMRRGKKSLYRSRVTGFSKAQTKNFCRIVISELAYRCISVKE